MDCYADLDPTAGIIWLKTCVQQLLEPEPIPTMISLADPKGNYYSGNLCSCQSDKCQIYRHMLLFFNSRLASLGNFVSDPKMNNSGQSAQANLVETQPTNVQPVETSFSLSSQDGATSLSSIYPRTSWGQERGLSKNDSDIFQWKSTPAKETRDQENTVLTQCVKKTTYSNSGSKGNSPHVNQRSKSNLPHVDQGVKVEGCSPRINRWMKGNSLHVDQVARGNSLHVDKEIRGNSLNMVQGEGCSPQGVKGKLTPCGFRGSKGEGALPHSPGTTVMNSHQIDLIESFTDVSDDPTEYLRPSRYLHSQSLPTDAEFQKKIQLNAPPSYVGNLPSRTNQNRARSNYIRGFNRNLSAPDSHFFLQPQPAVPMNPLEMENVRFPALTSSTDPTLSTNVWWPQTSQVSAGSLTSRVATQPGWPTLNYNYWARLAQPTNAQLYSKINSNYRLRSAVQRYR